MSKGLDSNSTSKGCAGVDQQRGDQVGDRTPYCQCWRVVVPLEMPSGNEFLRWHFRKRKQWQVRFEQYVWALGHPFPQYNCPCRVQITRMFGHRKRPYDTDNLYAGAKPILDTLKTPRGRSKNGLSIILEDNPKMCRLIVEQKKSLDKSTKILIEVFPLATNDASM